MPFSALSASLPVKTSAPSPPTAFSITVAAPSAMGEPSWLLAAPGVMSKVTPPVMAAKFTVSVPASSVSVWRAASEPWRDHWSV